MTTTNAYAVATDGEIHIDTVMPTRRGAIVNWLWVHCRQEITNATPDDVIEAHFEDWKQRRFDQGFDIEVMQVTVGLPAEPDEGEEASGDEGETEQQEAA